jgi:hypothetical protein
VVREAETYLRQRGCILDLSVQSFRMVEVLGLTPCHRRKVIIHVLDLYRVGFKRESIATQVGYGISLFKRSQLRWMLTTGLLCIY